MQFQTVSAEVILLRFFISVFFGNLILCNLLVGYIGEYECVDDHRAGKIVVELNGRLNKCGVISPRFDVGVKDMERWSNNLLPSRQFG